MKVLIRLFCASVAVMALASSGCSTSSSPGLIVFHTTYSAVGASDAVGVGSSVPCGTAGSPAIVTPPNCPGGKGYVPDLTGLLTNASSQVNLVDLGISGAVIGPDIETDVNACGQGATANFITHEQAMVSSSSTLVTIFAGGNDTNGIVRCAIGIVQGGGNPATFIAGEVTKFGTDYANIIAAIKALAPNAHIFLANLPNFKLIPVGQTQPAGVQTLLDQVSLALDVQVINPLANSPSVSGVVDLLCDPRSYATGNFSADGFHPDDAGYAILAQAYNAQVQSLSATKPAASCPPFSTADAVRPLSARDVAGSRLPRM
jgi:lysophospholipase L1-like esterase